MADDSGAPWEFLKDHEELARRLGKVQGTDLRCIRMMGTFIKAAAVKPGGASPTATPATAATAAAAAKGLVEQMVEILSGSWTAHPIVFLVGSDNTATPIDEIPYRFYTYIFVIKVVEGIVRRRRQAQANEPDDPNDQLVIRFTFVPEDILFAQFFFDDRHLFVAASYSWAAKQVPDDFAYAALALENIPAGETKPRFGETSRRLLQIYDARYRSQTKVSGEETWILRRTADREYAVVVSTPFWQRTNSVLQPFDFAYAGPPQTIELGQHGLEALRKHLEQMWGQEALSS